MKDKISVIVPVYNCEQSLFKCVMSVIEQTYKNIEIILVDDGSTDSSYFICSDLQKKFDFINIIHQENSGPASARNRGIEEATGKYIFFLDSDDYIDKDLLENLINKSTKDSSFLIGSSHTIVKSNSMKQINYNNELIYFEEFIIKFLNGDMDGFVWGYLFESSIAKKIRFDQNISLLEDSLFLIEYLEKKQKLCYINCESYYNYVINNTSITRKVNVERIIKNILNIDYSLGKIFTKLKGNKKINELNKLIIKRKYNLIIYELNKIYNITDLKKILDECNVKKILETLKAADLSIKQRLILNLYLSQNKFLMCLKKIKRLTK